MKTTELLKLKVGDSFIMNQPGGHKVCLITEIKTDQDHHIIHYQWEDEGDIGLAGIHVKLPADPQEELNALREAL